MLGSLLARSWVLLMGWTRVLLPSLIGLLHLGSFILVWLCVASLPAWLVLTVALWGDYSLHMALIFYALYRYFFPRRPWEQFREAHLKIAKKYQYFRTERLIIEDQSSERDTHHMMAWHPHGILCIGWTVNGNGSSELEKRGPYNWLGAWWMNNLPVLSELVKWQRGGEVGKQHLDSLMRAGQNVSLFPGGFEEATIFRYGHHQVYLKNRKGFIVYALRYGYKVSPVYTFGEELTYKSFEGLLEWRLWLNKWKVPAVLFWSKYIIFPDYNVDLVTVVGKPIQFPKIPYPTTEDVDKYFNIYASELERLFDRYKGEYADDPKAKLTIYK